MHTGHRERLKKKFLKYGLDGFEPHEALELLLFWAIPRKDTNELAHKLINKFGSITAVFDAPIKILKEIEGIGENSAIFLKLMPEIARIYQEDKHMINKKVPSLEDCYNKLVSEFTGRTEETVAIMLFDSKGKIVYDGIINKGSVNAVEIYSRRIIELLSAYSATSIIIAHNHPSGIALPSREDIRSTDKLKIIFENMSVAFIDHIIVADGDFVSMRQDKMSKAFRE